MNKNNHNKNNDKKRKKKLSRRGNEIFTPPVWHFLHCDQAWSDRVNLVKMCRLWEIMAFLEEKKRKEWQRWKE